MGAAFEALLQKQRDKLCKRSAEKNKAIISMLKKHAKNEIYLNGSFFYSTSADKASLQEIVDNFEKYHRINKNRWMIMPFGVNATGNKKWEKEEGFSLWFK